MKIGLLFAVSLFIFSPTFIYGSEFACHVSQWSIRAGDPREVVYGTDHIRRCADTCLQFICVIEDDVVIIGGGCYQNFEDTCRYIPTQLKQKIKKNMEYFQYADSSLILAMNNTDWGGENDYREMVKSKPNVEKNFAAHIKTRWNGTERVKFQDGKFDKSRDIKSSVQCGVQQSCKSGSNFDKPGTTEYSETKTCDACVSYMCTVNGKQIMSGNGCFEDFDKTCGNIAAIDKEVINGSIKNSFHYGKNFVVASCSDADNCAEAELQQYTYINKEAYETFTNNIDKSYGQSCEYRPLTEQEQINHGAAVLEAQNSSSNASLNVYLFWMIISGIILFYVW